MPYINDIENFHPKNEQERVDKAVILSFARANAHNVLLRENLIAHITSSGFVMNRSLDKVLLIHHNILNKWAWTGGHADGDADLLHVAMKEAGEETGAHNIHPLTDEIASIDILTVPAHERKGQYVGAHLHLSVAYILICDEGDAIRPRLSENTGVAWFGTDYFTAAHFTPADVYLYHKLIDRALSLQKHI